MTHTRGAVVGDIAVMSPVACGESNGLGGGVGAKYKYAKTIAELRY